MPRVLPGLRILGPINHQLCHGSVDPELPPTMGGASRDLPADEGLVLPISTQADGDLGTQADGDVGQGVGDGAGHHGACAPGHSDHTLSAGGVVPACGGTGHTCGSGLGLRTHTDPLPGAGAGDEAPGTGVLWGLLRTTQVEK